MSVPASASVKKMQEGRTMDVSKESTIREYTVGQEELQEQVLQMQSTIPLDGTDFMALIGPDGAVIPYEFEGWKSEMASWVDSAYLGAAISDQWFPYTIKGPHATEFLSCVFVNRFDNAPVGKSKHGLILNERGHIISDGIILRVAEDEYLTTCVNLVLECMLDQFKEQGKFTDVEGIDLNGKLCLYQVGGPKSLEILERACGENLHDIEYLHFRNVSIAGHTVRVFRMGMAGTLSYEIHVDTDICREVYTAIWEAGQKYDMKKLGYHAYMMNHTENGFQQYMLHFDNAYAECSEDLRRRMLEKQPYFEFLMNGPVNKGSDTNPNVFFVSPYDIGWGYLVNYDHDFIGKEAAWKAKNSRHRTMVTLEWNAQDIGEVFASQYAGGTPYMPMDNANDYLMHNCFAGFYHMHADKVLADGKQVGISTGRGEIVHYHTMISHASIDPEYAALGTVVTVLWGSEEYPQKEIRAKVVEFPYLKETLNGDFDVSKVPYGFK